MDIFWNCTMLQIGVLYADHGKNNWVERDSTRKLMLTKHVKP